MSGINIYIYHIAALSIVKHGIMVAVQHLEGGSLTSNITNSELLV